MDARVVVVGAPTPEETAAVTRGVATPSPVPSGAAPSTAVTATNGTVVATPASAPQNPVVVVANPSGNHQQPRILSRNVNGTCKLLSNLFNCDFTYWKS